MKDRILESTELLSQTIKDLMDCMSSTNQRLELIQQILAAEYQSVSTSSAPCENEHPKDTDESPVEEKSSDTIQTDATQPIEQQDIVLDQVKVECLQYKALLQESYLADFQPVQKCIDYIVRIVKDLYGEESVFYIRFSEASDSFHDFLSTIGLSTKDNLLNAKSIIVQHLKSDIDENGWSNIILRINSYRSIHSFRLNDEVSNQLSLLSSHVFFVYAKYGISLIVPVVLKDRFEKDVFDYSNEAIWTDKFCDKIDPLDYIGMVYDIIRIGYRLTDESGTCVLQKPVVYYNS